MKKIDNRSLIFIIVSLLIFLFLLVYFVIPGNVIETRSYQGPGTPFIHPP